MRPLILNRVVSSLELYCVVNITHYYAKIRGQFHKEKEGKRKRERKRREGEKESGLEVEIGIAKMSVTPEGMIGILWFFIVFDATFLAIRLYLIVTRPRVTIAAFASEACVFAAFLLFSLETSSTTVYQAMRIKYRDDPTVPKSLGMPRETLILIFKVRNCNNISFWVSLILPTLTVVLHLLFFFLLSNHCTKLILLVPTSRSRDVHYWSMARERLFPSTVL